MTAQHTPTLEQTRILADRLPPAEAEALRRGIQALVARAEQAERHVDQVANRATAVIVDMGADVRAAQHLADRYRTAWQSARRRAAVMTAEVTRRAPLNGQYAAAYETERQRAEQAEQQHDIDVLEIDLLRRRARDLEAHLECAHRDLAQHHAK